MAVWRAFFRTVSVQPCRKRAISSITIGIYGAPYETRTLVSGLIGQGLVNDDNYKEIMKKSVNQAIDLALVTDMVVATAGDRDQSF